MAEKGAEVNRLEQALDQRRAQKDAEMRTQADAAKWEAIKTARQKVAGEKAKTESKIRVVEAGKAQLQQQPEREAALTHEEAEKRAAEAPAAAMGEAEKENPARDPPGRVRRGHPLEVLQETLPLGRRHRGFSEQQGQQRRNPSPPQGQEEHP